MKNIQVIDGASNCTFSLFQATDDEFALLFPDHGQDMQYSEDLRNLPDRQEIEVALQRIWERPIRKQDAMGIHGTLLYQLQSYKKWYPKQREDAVDARAINVAQRRLFGSRPSPLPIERAWQVDGNGMLSGAPYHDGTLVGLHFVDKAHLTLAIRATDGQFTHLGMHGLRAVNLVQMCEGTIVLYIWVWKLAEIPPDVWERRDGAWSVLCDSRLGSPGPRNMVERSRHDNPDSYLVALTSSYGGEVFAVCDDISLRRFPDEARE